MLLKWLFTILAILWIYQALRSILGAPPARQAPPIRQSPPPQPAPPVNDVRQKQFDDEGEYIDYEEVK